MGARTYTAPMHWDRELDRWMVTLMADDVQVADMTLDEWIALGATSYAVDLALDNSEELRAIRAAALARKPPKSEGTVVNLADRRGS